MLVDELGRRVSDEHLDAAAKIGSEYWEKQKISSGSVHSWCTRDLACTSDSHPSGFTSHASLLEFWEFVEEKCRRLVNEGFSWTRELVTESQTLRSFFFPQCLHGSLIIKSHEFSEKRTDY